MAEDIKEQIGRLIREARLAKGYTQKEFAESLGVSEAAIYKYEKGQNFTVETLSRISTVLDVTVESLVRGH